MHGFGKLFYSNGTLAYEGQWKNNEFHGKGKVYSLEPSEITQPFDFKDLSVLDEEWVTYEGGLVNDRKEGWGILTLSNGERYEGNFRNDTIEGRGSYYQMNGAVC